MYSLQNTSPGCLCWASATGRVVALIHVVASTTQPREMHKRIPTTRAFGALAGP